MSSVATLLKDKIEEKQNANRAKGWKAYLDHLRAYVEGKEPPIDKILSCMESIGKGPEDFDQDVETMRKRFESFDKLTKRYEFRVDAPNLDAEYRRIKEEAKQSAIAYEAKIKEAFFACQTAKSGIQEADEAEKYLLDSCLDLTLHARKIELQKRWETTHQALQVAEKEKNHQKANVSSANSERQRLIRTHSHPSNIESIDSQLPYAEEHLEELQSKFDSIQAEMQAINEEIEEVNNLMLHP